MTKPNAINKIGQYSPKIVHPPKNDPKIANITRLTRIDFDSPGDCPRAAFAERGRQDHPHTDEPRDQGPGVSPRRPVPRQVLPIQDASDPGHDRSRDGQAGAGGQQTQQEKPRPYADDNQGPGQVWRQPCSPPGDQLLGKEPGSEQDQQDSSGQAAPLLAVHFHPPGDAQSSQLSLRRRDDPMIHAGADVRPCRMAAGSEDGRPRMRRTLLPDAIIRRLRPDPVMRTPPEHGGRARMEDLRAALTEADRRPNELLERL